MTIPKFIYTNSEGQGRINSARALQLSSFPFIPFSLPFELLRENPYESLDTHLIDLICPQSVIYKKEDLTLQAFEEEVRKFGEIEKMLLRWRYIPAGDGFLHTSKKKLKNSSGKGAWDFIKMNVALEEEPEDKNKIETKIYSSGHYFATLRNLSSKFWMHVVSPKVNWPAYTEIDIIGKG